MQTNLKFEPPSDLFNKVMSRIEEEKRIAAAKRKLLLFSGFFIFSLAAIFPMWNTLQSELSRSGFGQYLTLFFYDFRSITAYWQDFGLTLLETVPAVSLAGILTVLLALIFSLRSVIRYSQLLLKFRNIHSHSH